MRKLVFIVGSLFAILALLYVFQSGAVSRRNDQPEWPTVQVTRADMNQSTVATGTIKSKVGAEVKVGSQISGVVSKLYVNVGDNVRKGQLLAQLDDSALRARMNTQQAELNAAQAEFDFAKGEVARFEQLGPMVPRVTLENSRRNMAVRAANIAQATSRVADAGIQLAFVRITAPIGGVIASVSTYEGETVAANFAAPTFVTIVDLSRLEIQSYVDETDIGKINVGQKVSFRVDAYAGSELSGTVRAIYPKPQLINNVVNYIVIVDMEQRDGLLIRPEMTAHVSFTLAAREKALGVPRSAVLNEGKQSFVIMRSAGQWVKRPVTIGMHTPQRLEVATGLKEADTVLADAQLWKDEREGKKND